MKEIRGNLWDAPDDYKIITTNGMVARSGELVMGKGVALDAKLKYPALPKLLGSYVKAYGNIPMIIHDYNLMTFPTKNHWMDKSDLELIKMSAIKVYNMLPREATAALVRPGCGHGGLNWADVKPMIENILDNRFTVYSV